MLREPAPQQYPFEMVTLEELVPEDHLVRKIDATIDFEFIRDAVAHLYCPDNGRPAIDPVRLIKMMLLGYLFGVPSERRLVKEIQVNNAYRWFLRMGLTEKVPDASPLSQNRICRFNHSDIFQQIFDHIVELALSQGMANGRGLYTDSTHLKADANPRKAVNELRPEGVSEYLEQLNAAVEADRKQHEKKPLPAVKNTPESAAAVNNTRVSTTDRNGYRHYRSDANVCAACPMREKCAKNRKRNKTITRHVWEEAKAQANVLRLTTWGKKVYARRKETVERSFADAKQHTGPVMRGSVG